MVIPEMKHHYDEVFIWAYAKKSPDKIKGINNAQVLVMVGDSITTDHISPAGAFATDSPAGKYLTDNGVSPTDFNSFG